MRHALRPWWPIFVWVAVIFGLSSIPDLPGEDAGLPRHADKVAHVVEYLVLSVLFYRGLGSDRHRHWLVVGLVTFVTCLGIAALDELYQSYRPERDASGWDLAADGIGILAGTAVAILRRRMSNGRAGVPGRT